MTAKLVLGVDKVTSPKSCLCKLHWLPIRERIHFKMLCLIYKALNGLAPEDLISLLTVHTNSMYKGY